jgi:glycosyltransferase involved in cell wall biosynthesis
LALEVKRRYPELPVTWTWIGAVDSLVYSLTLTDAILLGIDFQFTGEIRNPLEEYFKRDLMILTSREEPSSLAGFESSILGKPVMYFKDRTGFEEVDENAAELAFEYGDLAAMSDKIKELAENRDKLKTLGERNRIKFRNYMLENMAESFIQIIENA